MTMTLRDSYSRDFFRLFGDDIRQAARKVHSLESTGRFQCLTSGESVACSVIEEADYRLTRGGDLDDLLPVLSDAISTVQAL